MQYGCIFLRLCSELSKLSPAFSHFFIKINKTHNYNTRLASKETFCLPAVRITNYGKFNIRFQGVKVWNSIVQTPQKIFLQTKGQIRYSWWLLIILLSHLHVLVLQKDLYLHLYMFIQINYYFYFNIILVLMEVSL